MSDSIILPFEPYKEDEPYIFASYAHKDKEIVFNILHKLHQRGYRIWYDRGIEPGEVWLEII